MKVFQWLSVLVIVMWLVPKACVERIDPDTVGVRRSVSGGVDGVDHPVGYSLSVPLWHRWYKLDKTIHYLKFSDRDGGALDVRTKENNVIFIDVTVPYRIIDGEAWRIVAEGFTDTYRDKVKSTTVGILREYLAEMSALDVQDPKKRKDITARTLPVLNEALAQYHIEATHVVLRAIRFRPQYEDKLQNKQFYVVQGKLDGAVQAESVARQETETLQKTIDKDVALKVESWNRKIEELRTTYELQIAEIQAESVAYARKKRSEADATFTELQAEGELAQALAAAAGEKMKAAALSTKAGRTFSAVEAAQRFELGDVVLDSSDPEFLYRFGSMNAWRRFFLGEE